MSSSTTGQLSGGASHRSPRWTVVFSGVPMTKLPCHRHGGECPQLLGQLLPCQHDDHRAPGDAVQRGKPAAVVDQRPGVRTDFDRQRPSLERPDPTDDQCAMTVDEVWKDVGEELGSGD